MTPAGQRKMGIVFMVLGAAQLIFTLFTGRMEGLDGLFNMVTGQFGVPPTFADKPFVFLAGLALCATLLAYGFKLFRESRRAPS
jgi:vacuolar-type H+-ATPase subunit I/STV1